MDRSRRAPRPGAAGQGERAAGSPLEDDSDRVERPAREGAGLPGADLQGGLPDGPARCAGHRDAERRQATDLPGMRPPHDLVEPGYARAAEPDHRRQAAEHRGTPGHNPRRIDSLFGSSNSAAQERRAAYLEAMGRHGLALQVRSVAPNAAAAREEATRWLEEPGQPVARVVPNGLIPTSAVRAA